MRLPGWENARVAPAKISDYLLASDHPTGQYKAEWLSTLGFRPIDASTLSTAILNHAAEHEVAHTTTSAFGTTYVVDGAMETPAGARPRVRSIWFLGHNDDSPALVTLYPLRRRR